MSYTALYRKFRPAEFEDVKGQDHIITTLKNQIKADRIGHAYLFCGTRGTGKTTVAKIFAKAVNCEHPVDGSPCGECAMCKSIAAGTSMNVIEIDAASNNGVDNIREIREEVTYRPTEGKYKVYIIDEVHMLSIGAFNALLKTLEEPPEYVIFILATTEVHKIPITILSRCQRYDFHRITAATIKKQLKDLMEQEQVDTEDKALEYYEGSLNGGYKKALVGIIDIYYTYREDYKRVEELLEKYKGELEKLKDNTTRYMLGSLYAEGNVKQDLEKAKKYLLESAEDGFEYSQLALMYLYAKYMPKQDRNYSKAYYWYLMAKERGDEIEEDDNEFAKNIKKSLTAEEIKRIEKEVSEKIKSNK